MTIKRIFSLPVANELISKGHNVVKIKLDKFNPAKQIFVFERTESLIQDLIIISEKIKNKKN